jgi:hypothetical protein
MGYGVIDQHAMHQMAFAEAQTRIVLKEEVVGAKENGSSVVSRF